MRHFLFKIEFKEIMNILKAYIYICFANDVVSAYLAKDFLTSIFSKNKE